MKSNINTRLADCRLLKLPQIGSRVGHITAVNNNAEIPFAVTRVFYIYDIPAGESRGAHAHLLCHQCIVAVSGSFQVLLDDGHTQQTISLNQPNQGLYIPHGIWASQINFSAGSIALVLASQDFTESDYLRDYQKYLSFKGIGPKNGF